MLRIRKLNVEKAGRKICHVGELDVARGERLAVIGPNGSGKTTLLRVVGGLESHFAGECRVDAPHRDRVYVHQAPYLLRGSVLFNTTYGLAARRMPRRQRKAAAREWLVALGVEHLIHRRGRRLSGGETRRVALARALAVRPDLLLLDEPLADLDEAGIAAVCRALSALPNTTILIASPVPLPADFSVTSFVLPKN